MALTAIRHNTLAELASGQSGLSLNCEMWIGSATAWNTCASCLVGISEVDCLVMRAGHRWVNIAVCLCADHMAKSHCSFLRRRRGLG